MTAGSGAGPPDAAGGLARHVPVLVRQAVDYLNVRDGGLIIDATFGAGGYYARNSEAADCQVIGIDRDPHADCARHRPVEAAAGRLALIEDRFSALEDAAQGEGVDGVVLDLGVSSMQLDEAERGFSFRFDGPLDMRMGGDGPTAADVIARASERDLASIIFLLGEERHSRAVARAIVKARSERADCDDQGAGRSWYRVSCAASPARFIPRRGRFRRCGCSSTTSSANWWPRCRRRSACLSPAAAWSWCRFIRLKIVSSRIFSTARSGVRAGSRHLPEIAAAPATFHILTKRPVGPDDAEIAANPRARSAKLRAAERTDASARGRRTAGAAAIAVA